MIRRTVLLAALVAVPRAAGANPVDVSGFGGRAPAMGNAQTAAAVDGSAHYFNPALLATFDEIRIDLGYMLSAPTLLVNGENLGVDTSRGFASSINTPGHIGPVKVAFGAGVFVPDDHLSRVRTLNGQQPRWQLYDNRPQRLYLAANLAVQVTSKLFLGGGISYMSSTAGGIELQGRVGFPDAEASDLDMAIDVDLKNVRYGQAGVFYRALDWLDVGLSYRSSFVVDLQQAFLISGDVGTEGMEPVVEDGYLFLETRAQDLYQPEQFTAGVSARLGDRWTVALDVGFHRWSKFENPAAEITIEYDLKDFNDLVMIDDAPALEDPNFHDIVIPRIGAEWVAHRSDARVWELRGGYTYEPTPAPEQTGESNFIDNTKHTLSAGVGLTLNHIGRVIRLPVSFDAFFGFTFLEPRTHHKVSPVDPVGDYRSSGRVWHGGLASRWRF